MGQRPGCEAAEDELLDAGLAGEAGRAGGGLLLRLLPTARSERRLGYIVTLL